MAQKTLVIVLGQARADKLTWNSFKNNLLNELGADLALCVGDTPENNDSNMYWVHSKFRWLVTEYEDFGDGFDQIQSDRYGISADWRKVFDVGNQWLGGIKGNREQPGSAGLLIYFRAKLYDILKKEKITKHYDRFIITRSDFIWEIPHPKVERLNMNKIWIPYGEFYGGVTDRHVILSKKHLGPYLDLIHPILTNPEKLVSDMLAYNPRHIWNLERYILYHLKSLNLEDKIRFIPYMMYSVRDKLTKTRWAKGKFDHDLGLYVKYPTERIRAQITKKYLVSKSGKLILFNNFLMQRYLETLFSLKTRNLIK